MYKKPKSYEISYPTAVYENVVMIPTNMIYHENSKNNSSQYDYVWLLKDGEIVKQYITLGDASNTATIILTGLSEGDVIIRESAHASAKKDQPSSTDDSNGSSDSSDDSSDTAEATTAAEDGTSDGMSDDADNAGDDGIE